MIVHSSQLISRQLEYLKNLQPCNLFSQIGREGKIKGENKDKKTSLGYFDRKEQNRNQQKI